MADLAFVTTQHLPGEATLSHVTDLAIRQSAAGPMLYSTTRYGGALVAWSIGGTGLTRIDSVAHSRSDAAGALPDLGFVTRPDGGLSLLYGGGFGGGLDLRRIDADGGFGSRVSLGTPAALPGDLTHSVSLDIAGQQIVYGGVAGAAGIARLVFSASGGLAATVLSADNSTTHADQVAALGAATVGGIRYLFSVGGADPGITSWMIGSSGGLSMAANLGIDDGLWISVPTALEVIRTTGPAGPQTWLVLAAAGSGSLSVMQVRADGSLGLSDHVLDDLGTRFQGVTALASAVLDGIAYIAAGGADDGITLFQLLPNGHLLARATLADTTAMALADVSAIEMRAAGGGLDLFVASATDLGLTRLRYDPGAAGPILTAAPGGGSLWGNSGADLLCGGDGADLLYGGSGDDVLLDGAGYDRLTGGPGADIFVLAADNSADTITDFSLGVDRIDVSAWTGLRSMSQLTLAQTATGFSISFGAETLVVTSAAGSPINPSWLTAGDLIGQSRLDPTLYTDGPLTCAGPDITGTPGADLLVAGAIGNKILSYAGDDRLIGGSGQDHLIGGDGRDYLDGGGGRNLLEGGSGNDCYVVRGLSDTISGEQAYSQGGGIDTVMSWISLTLPQNVEILRLQGGADLNGYGNGNPEVLVGNPGANTLSGGWGNDRIVAKSGNDILIGGGGADELVGDAGADCFVYTGVFESRAGVTTRDFINGFEHGADHIDLSLIDADPFRAGDQAFRFLGATGFHGTGAGSAAELRYASYGGDWTIIEADLNGDGSADLQIFVNVTNYMTGSDFIL